MVKSIAKKITIDDLAAMFMREFTFLRKYMDERFDKLEARMDASEKRMDASEKRLENICGVVLQEHKPRMKTLEKEVFLR